MIHSTMNVTHKQIGFSSMSYGGYGQEAEQMNMHVWPGVSFENRATISAINGSGFNEDTRYGGGFVNNGLIQTIGASTVTIRSDLSGSGTIISRAAPNGGSGKIELSGAVGTGQHVEINAGTLQLDYARAFHGSIGTLGVTSGRVVLEGVHATTASYSGGELVLKNGAATLADLHFTGMAGAAATRSAGPFVTNEGDGTIVISGYSLPNTGAVHPAQFTVQIAPAH